MRSMCAVAKVTWPVDGGGGILSEFPNVFVSIKSQKQTSESKPILMEFDISWKR